MNIRGQINVANVITALATAVALGGASLVWDAVKPNETKAVDYALLKQDVATLKSDVAALKAQGMRIESAIIQWDDKKK